MTIVAGIVNLAASTAARSALMPGARVVKAFNALYAGSPRRIPAAPMADSMGFAPVGLGGLHDTGRLMQVGGGPLSGLQRRKARIAASCSIKPSFGPAR